MSSANVKTSEKVHLEINQANLLLKQLFVTWSFSWVIGLWSTYFEAMKQKRRRKDLQYKTLFLSNALPLPQNPPSSSSLRMQTFQKKSRFKDLTSPQKIEGLSLCNEIKADSNRKQLLNNKVTVCAGEYSCFVQKLLSFLWQYKGFPYTLVSREFLTVCQQNNMVNGKYKLTDTVC